MNIKTMLHRQIEKIVIEVAEKDFKTPLELKDLPPVLLEEPPQKEFGDYATSFAMQAAKTLKKSPKIIAEAIISRINARKNIEMLASETGTYWLKEAVIAGPGFINFYLSPDWVKIELKSILAAGDDFGSLNTGESDAKKEKIQVEFVSANPTGPLHVGHGRGAAVGSALVNLLRKAGHEVEAEFYINDAGNQIDNLAASVAFRYLELLGKTGGAKMPEDGYFGQDIIDTAQRIIDLDGDKYLAVSETERLAIFKELALKEKLAALKEDLAAFGVNFDVWFSERKIHETGAVAKTVALLKESGHIYEKEGALWLNSTAYGDDKDRVVIRDNGIPTYLAADIAYHRDKFERRFDRVINIWGADHHGYISRVKAAVGALGYSPEQLEVLILQMVSLYQNGQLVKMSKRTGQGVTLSELIEEVGRDAARFFFIMRSVDSQLDFDLDLAKSQSNENPVYYIQYAHARISSIFRQAAEAGISTDFESAKFGLLIEESETSLIKKLSRFPEEVENAAKDRAPHRLARYAHELAGLFHSFYNNCRILGVSPDLQAARLGLVAAVQRVIKNCLAVLGIDAPDKM